MPGTAAGRVGRSGWTTDTDELDDYLEKSPSAGRMGKAVEYLVAAACTSGRSGES